MVITERLSSVFVSQRDGAAYLEQRRLPRPPQRLRDACEGKQPSLAPDTEAPTSIWFMTNDLLAHKFTKL